MISSLLISFLPAAIMLLDNLSLISVISMLQAILARIPATRSNSTFQLRIKRLLRSIDSRSTVGMTEGVDMWACKPVAEE